MTTVVPQPTVLGGSCGGFVTALLLTPALASLGDGSVAPPDHLWSKLVGGSPADATRPGTLLHLCYGSVAGVGYVFLEPVYPVYWVDAVRGPVRSSLLIGATNGVILAVVLSVVAVGAYGLRFRSGPSRKRIGATVLFYVTYGVILGSLFGVLLTRPFSL